MMSREFLVFAAVALAWLAGMFFGLYLAKRAKEREAAGVAKPARDGT